MPAFPSNRKLNIMSTPTLVGSNVVQAVGVATPLKMKRPQIRLFLHQSAMEPRNKAIFMKPLAKPLEPICQFCFDRRQSLCPVHTNQRKYILLSSRWHRSNHLLWCPIDRVNGSNPIETDQCAQQIIQAIRDHSLPEFLF